MNARRFIRHPAHVPVDIRPADTQSKAPEQTAMLNFSPRGLAMKCMENYPIGKALDIRLPHIDPSFTANGKVAWSQEQQDGSHVIGVVFSDRDTSFRVRMLEQICHIESYWQQAQQQGRDISIEQAAREWIGKHAENFPEG